MSNEKHTDQPFCGEATKKNPAIDALLTAITGKNRVTTVATNGCVFCMEPNLEFRDALSKREYTISGMCQTCQDKTFGGFED